MRAEITLRDGQIRYQTVMFPNSPFWASTILADCNVAYVRQVQNDAPYFRWEHERIKAERS